MMVLAWGIGIDFTMFSLLFFHSIRYDTDTDFKNGGDFQLVYLI